MLRRQLAGPERYKSADRSPSPWNTGCSPWAATSPWAAATPASDTWPPPRVQFATEETVTLIEGMSQPVQGRGEITDDGVDGSGIRQSRRADGHVIDLPHTPVGGPSDLLGPVVRRLLGSVLRHCHAPPRSTGVAAA